MRRLLAGQNSPFPIHQLSRYPLKKNAWLQIIS